MLAELSLVLPPGWTSTPAAVVSLALLLAVPAMMLLPRDRMPSWTPVLVPLAYTGSVLALLLTVGPTSGVGIVILIPLIWTALYHRRWESACVVAAIVAVEVTVSLVPVRVADAVLFRRIVLWTALGTLISMATHGLRDGIRRAQEQRPRPRPGCASSACWRTGSASPPTSRTSSSGDCTRRSCPWNRRRP